jgi:hypothetical protein
MVNQQNPPLPKKKRVDSKGNDVRRVFAKSGTATLEIVKGLNVNAALVFTEKVQELADSLGGQCTCNFHIAR